MSTRPKHQFCPTFDGCLEERIAPSRALPACVVATDRQIVDRGSCHDSGRDLVKDFRILRDRAQDAVSRVSLIARTRVRLDDWVLGLVDGGFTPAFAHLSLAPPVLSPWPPCAAPSLPRAEHEQGPTRLSTSTPFLLVLLLLAGIGFAAMAGVPWLAGIAVVLVGANTARVFTAQDHEPRSPPWAH